MSARSPAESAVKGFLTDYYCTSESWSVKTSAHRVLSATNSWLHAQTRRSQYSYDRDKGYVCTLSAMVLKSTTAHIFHVGDARIYRLAGNALEQLTDDHRVVVSSEQSYLGRALGVNPQIEIDYLAASGREGRCLSCWRPTASTNMSPPASSSTADQGQRGRSRSGRNGHRRRSLTTGQPRQSDGPDRPGRSNCRTATPARFSGSRGIAASAAAGSADAVRRLPHRPGIACQQPKPHLSGGRYRNRGPGRHQDSVDRSARRSRLSEALHDGGMGRPAHRQSARAETAPARRASAIISTS